MKGIVPTQATFDLAERTLHDARERRADQAKEERLRTRAKQIDREADTAEAYDRRVTELQSASAKLQEQAAILVAPNRGVGKMLELATRFSRTLMKVGKNAASSSRVWCCGRYLQALWCSAERGLSNCRNDLSVQGLALLSGTDFRMVPGADHVIQLFQWLTRNPKRNLTLV
ncbi:hypothetical protein [Pararhodobacter marinus]|uniref:hypothetical protein n=2 Tax=Pararhodobacter marinus TaxID=2184063 RepID=UPI0035146440